MGEYHHPPIPLKNQVVILPQNLHSFPGWILEGDRGMVVFAHASCWAVGVYKMLPVLGLEQGTPLVRTPLTYLPTLISGKRHYPGDPWVSGKPCGGRLPSKVRHNMIVAAHGVISSGNLRQFICAWEVMG